ncbi:MAG: hypothetical protein HY881_17800 [Deltaproteobacteria bacterium]|nr:hypothetical protein [Deltaproteobacteria bacterium]
MYQRTFILVSMIVISVLIVVGHPPLALDANDHGKLIVQEQCTKCHNLRRVKAYIGKLDMPGWTDLVNKMLINGAKLTPEEKDAVVKFLSSAPSPSALD